MTRENSRRNFASTAGAGPTVGRAWRRQPTLSFTSGVGSCFSLPPRSGALFRLASREMDLPADMVEEGRKRRMSCTSQPYGTTTGRQLHCSFSESRPYLRPAEFEEFSLLRETESGQ